MFSTENKKKISANITLLLFIMFVAGTAFLTNIFKINPNGESAITQNLKLFKNDEVILLNKITFKNKNGEFTFEKNENNQVSPWQMTTPRKIAANTIFFEKLATFLTSSNIKKIYSNDKINNSNFSLEKPTSSFDLYLKDNKIIHLDFGLLNTIDNSIYIKSSKQSGIIHVEAPTISFENASLLDLIESQIFSLDLENISKLKIFKDRKSTEPTFEIVKNENTWTTKDGIKLNISKLDDYIEELSFLKSSFILDKQTDLQRKQIGNLKKNSEYIVSIEDSKKNIIDYHISGIIKDIADVELKGEPHFLITTSNSSTAYLVKKEFFTLFEMKVDKLKEDSSK